MGSCATAVAASSAGGQEDKAKTEEFPRKETPPVKVHSRWDLTHTTYWVDLDELFRTQKTQKMLKLLKRMYDEQDRVRRSAPHPD